MHAPSLAATVCEAFEKGQNEFSTSFMYPKFGKMDFTVIFNGSYGDRRTDIDLLLENANARSSDEIEMATFKIIFSDEKFDIYDRFVVPNYRKNGLGAFMEEFTEELARNMEVPSLIVEPYDFAPCSIQLDVVEFLRKRGFLPDDRLTEILNSIQDPEKFFIVKQDGSPKAMSTNVLFMGGGKLEKKVDLEGVQIVKDMKFANTLDFRSHSGKNPVEYLDYLNLRGNIRLKFPDEFALMHGIS